MKNKFYSFPSIEQFRTVVKYVNDRCGYHGIKVKPTLKFVGTVKLHGTNAGVVVTPAGEVYAQSRSAVITPQADNAGFAAFVEKNKELFGELASKAATRDDDVILYGEWCGAGIQKNVAIVQLSKRFVLFAVRIGENRWLSPGELQAIRYEWTTDIDNIHNYSNWEIDIDFENPALSQNRLVELTQAVEDRCPVGYAHGATGTGEGIVWVCAEQSYTSDALTIQTSDLIFKVKGKKHSDTKTTNLAPVDVEKMNAIAEIADAVTTDHRLEKGLDHVRLENPNVDIMAMQYVPQFLKWVGQDVIKEESDMIAASGFDPKDVTKAVNVRARNWFKEQVDNSLK